MTFKVIQSHSFQQSEIYRLKLICKPTPLDVYMKYIQYILIYTTAASTNPLYCSPYFCQEDHHPDMKMQPTFPFKTLFLPLFNLRQ